MDDGVLMQNRKWVNGCKRVVFVKTVLVFKLIMITV